MKLETAQALSDACPDIEIRKDYSGRAMYGQTTAAVVYPTLGVLLSAACIVAGQSEDNGETLALELAKCRFDNMGHDFIAY